MMPSYTEDEPEESGLFDASIWVGDEMNPATGNVFTAEIENVSESDWDFDSDLLWGTDTGSDLDEAGPDLLV